MTKINIEIDGKKVQVDSSDMVIEAADRAGIYIPRFCYHKKLSIAANCRMCLVEVEKAAKPLPACATPVTDGMKVFTRSAKAIAAQKGVMEFLLINHPLDCPVCDQAGECELQDISLGFGEDVSKYSENKRVVKDKDIGPLIATEMTRCIHCTRCVRFGDEIAGLRELGATARGEHMEIGTYIEGSVDSELSGNVIDLCPVGALTSKPFRFKARAWEMTQYDSVAPHDCVGSNLHLHVRNQQVMRVVPRENEEVNETWLADRDRYSYEGLNHQQRLTEPMIKVDGEWRSTDWNTALEHSMHCIRKVTEQHGVNQLGALLSPSATTEELYLAQRLMRGIGSHNIDHRLRQLDSSDQALAPAFPWLGQSLQALESLDAALLIGANVRKDQPLAAHRIRKAALKGAAVMLLNAVDHAYHFPLAQTLISAPQHMLAELAGVARALSELSGKPLPADLGSLVNGMEISAGQRKVAEHLHNANKASILLGNYAHAHPQFTDLRALAGLIAQLSNAKLGYLTEGGNASGAWLSGALPHRTSGGRAVDNAGLDATAMLRERRKAYLLLGVEPDLDCANPPVARAALQSAEFVVAMSAYRSAELDACCDVLLPITPFTETSGTFINAEGRWQSFSGVVRPLGEARPAWKVLRVLGNLFEIDGFNYMSSDEVLAEVKEHTAKVTPDNTLAWRCPQTLQSNITGLVRRAHALQQTRDANVGGIRISAALAAQAGVAEAAMVAVRQGTREMTLPLVIDERVADNSVLVHAGMAEGAHLMSDFEPLSLHPAAAE